MAKKRIIAYFMHENEQAAAMREMPQGISTESYVVDESHLGTLKEFHAERRVVYHASQKAAEEWNGRPLTDFEKEELWQLSRSDAAINIDEKKNDPSEQPDH